MNAGPELVLFTITQPLEICRRASYRLRSDRCASANAPRPPTPPRMCTHPMQCDKEYPRSTTSSCMEMPPNPKKESSSHFYPQNLSLVTPRVTCTNNHVMTCTIIVREPHYKLQPHDKSPNRSLSSRRVIPDPPSRRIDNGPASRDRTRP